MTVLPTPVNSATLGSNSRVGTSPPTKNLNTKALDRMTAPTEPKDIKVPISKAAKEQGYTIGNRMEYCDIALDLDPEKWRKPTCAEHRPTD